MYFESLETGRLLVRPFRQNDLPVIHHILDQTFGDGSKIDDEAALKERGAWLRWQMLNEEWLPKLHQPPYGDRAITLKATGKLIGSVGYVPCLDVFEQIPELRTTAEASGYNTTEFGLFWAVDPRHQGKGYATEAAQAMIDYAFDHLRLNRLIATTEYTNAASIRVMHKLGFTITRNPLDEPSWLQIVGVLENNR